MISGLCKQVACLFFLLNALALSVSAEVQFPAASGWVNDFAGVLSPAEKSSLNSIAQSLKDKTGAEMAIAIVKTASPLDPKLYTVKLLEKWGIGQKGKDNGVLVLLAADEHRIEIEVGYGLEGVLPDALCGQILDQYAIPYFKQGQFGQGLLETARALSAVIAKEAMPQKTVSPSAAESSTESPDLSYIFLAVVVVLIIFAIIFRKAGSMFWGIFGAIWGSSYAGIPGLIFG
ncbi:MAG: TPM domain-containing protein, partial [Candidatus Margulisiibacteriota bacterium]